MDISLFLHAFDLFSISPGSRFTFKKSKLYTSMVGKFASTIIYALTLTAVYYFSRGFINKTQGQITTSEILTPNPEAFPLNKDTFFFAFALQNSSNNFLAFIDEQIYTIDAKLRIKESNNFTIKSIQIGECDSSDYPTNPDLNQYFMSNSLKGYYCIKNWTELEMVGYWDSVFFKELQFYVRPCRNVTGGTICKDQKYIDDAFKDGYFGSFLSSGVVDPGNYENPIQYSPMNFYARISLKTYVFIEMSMQHNEIQTDSGSLLEDISIQKGISKTTERQSVMLDPQDMVFELLIRLDRIKKVFTRKYDKIQDVLANVGGVYNFLMVVGSLLFGSLIDFQMAVDLSHNIFDISGSNKNGSSKISPQNSIKNGTIPEINPPSSLRKKKTSFPHFGFSENLRNWKRKIKVLWLAKKQIDMKLDISYIMSKILEIEKLKYIIFDANQLFLFDLMPKPKIFAKKHGIPAPDDKMKAFHKRLLNSQLINVGSRGNKAGKITENLDAIMNKTNKTLFDQRFLQILVDSNLLEKKKSLLFEKFENSSGIVVKKFIPSKIPKTALKGEEKI